MKLIILGRPISKDNQSRAMSKSGHYFLREEFREYERSVRLQAIQQIPDGFQPYADLLRVTMTFFFKDHRRPDLMNAPKSVCDALNEIVWIDDKQIVSAGLAAQIDGKNPRVEIDVEEIK